jgi:hypothetical protein
MGGAIAVHLSVHADVSPVLLALVVIDVVEGLVSVSVCAASCVACSFGHTLTKLALLCNLQFSFAGLIIYFGLALTCAVVGSAMDALSAMDTFLRSRPSTFASQKVATVIAYLLLFFTPKTEECLQSFHCLLTHVC